MAFENNVQGTLYADVAIGASTIDVNKAVAPDKDVPEEGRLTLFAAGVTEIITYTGRVDNTTYWTLTGVVKNTEVGVGDQSWTTGDGFFQAVTARDLVGFMTVRVAFIATANQSTKSGLTYTVGNLDCFINGSLMTIGTDFTANNGTSVVFTPALTELDEVQLFMNIGATTADGIDGVDGEKGDTGDTGETGAVSTVQGPQGDQGIQGETGADSTVAGPPGADGADGGGGGSEADFIASGTLSNGATVILKSNGQVEAVTTVGAAEGMGAAIIYEEVAYAYAITAYDPFNANKFILTYSDSASGAKVVVGAVSGSTLTFGTPLQYASITAVPKYVLFDSNLQNSFVLCFGAGSNSYLLAGTIAGDSITVGSTLTHTGAIGGLVFDPNIAGQVLSVAGSLSVNVYAIAGNTVTLSGTSTSVQTGALGTRIGMDPTTPGSIALMWGKNASPAKTYVMAATLSGSTVTFNTPVEVSSLLSQDNAIIFLPATADKFIAMYANSGDSFGVVCTISGTTVSVGTPIAMAPSQLLASELAFDPNDHSRFVFVYSDSGNSYYDTSCVGYIAGDTLSFGTPLVHQSSVSWHNRIAFDPYTSGAYTISTKNAQSYIVFYQGQLATPAVENLTAANFLGTATAAYTDAQTATITLQGGLSTNQTGLTIGATYYVQADGTLATTADTIRVVAGKALSGTSMLLAAFEDVDVSGGGGGGEEEEEGGGPADSVYIDGAYTYHKFTTSGIFTALTGSIPSTFEYLVVAGGGSGGDQVPNVSNGGGGGAGGYISGSYTTNETHAITIGAGGSINSNGEDSQLGTAIIAIGGGRAGHTATPGGDGGSGGGGAAYGSAGLGGSGTAGQGFDGADGVGSGSWVGGGGGGAAGVGTQGGNVSTGDGGPGLEWLGLGTFYAGGGGGGGNVDYYVGDTFGPGGVGGGGSGGSLNTVAENGGENTGGGGGGSGAATDPSGLGGSGIVIIRYLT